MQIGKLTASVVPKVLITAGVALAPRFFVCVRRLVDSWTGEEARDSYFFCRCRFFGFEGPVLQVAFCLLGSLNQARCFQKENIHCEIWIFFQNSVLIVVAGPSGVDRVLQSLRCKFIRQHIFDALETPKNLAYIVPKQRATFSAARDVCTVKYSCTYVYNCSYNCNYNYIYNISELYIALCSLGLGGGRRANSIVYV